MMEDSCGQVMTTAAHAAEGAFRSSAHAAETFRSSAPELLSKTCGGDGDDDGMDGSGSGRFGVGLGLGLGVGRRANGIDIPHISCTGLGLDCGPDDESETESYDRKNNNKNGRGGKGKDKGGSSSRRSSMKKNLVTTQLQQKINHVTRRDLLRDRVEDYRAKGWLTQQEHRKYLAFISSFETTTTTTTTSAIGGASDGGSTHGMKELEVELDLLERRSANKSIWNKILTPTTGMMNSASAATNGTKVAIATTPSAFKNSNNNNNNVLSSSTNRFLNQQQKDHQTTTSKDDRKSQQEHVELSRKTIVRPKELERIMNEHLVSELFVDTSFFARLGYVQPPCCMKCTYRESMMGTAPDLKCERWVVWRRNAKQTLHPKSFRDNSVIVKCRSARQLISGKFVEGFKW
eukprot:CAMPEP_0113462392 /NCGR_PEP_ID=MMETSP0014_2-20120614/12064_1 /TAXON_ID=2857 /ORGANISM="Nitzschia sp." /LENGTH=403 /DNA_ID=CAMNT_0000354245 /DNA_START=118 /DNA_END=1326 /DNA_ORIENTATION=+ /assembly_acc=CAM_ASM_000159